MQHKPLRVGFDLDGVLLYNPARIVRPFIALVKSVVESKPKTKFHYPHNFLEREIWKFLHLSSMFVASGYKDAQQLIKDKKIESYIVTARYSFLKDDFAKWKKKLNTKEYFIDCFNNEKDEQPHLFKERMIRELDIDVFIEDNWDIVNHLHKSFQKKPGKKPLKVLWIYNIFDRGIDYPYKYPSLAKAIEEIKKMI